MIEGIKSQKYDLRVHLDAIENDENIVLPNLKDSLKEIVSIPFNKEKNYILLDLALEQGILLNIGNLGESDKSRLAQPLRGGVSGSELSDYEYDAYRFYALEVVGCIEKILEEKKA